MSSYYVLYESASGYALFDVHGFDELANSADDLQQSIIDVSRFGKNVKLAAFKPFTSAANALEQINAVSESQVRMQCVSLQHLREFRPR
jgi:nucleolar protein 56